MSEVVIGWDAATLEATIARLEADKAELRLALEEMIELEKDHCAMGPCLSGDKYKALLERTSDGTV